MSASHGNSPRGTCGSGAGGSSHCGSFQLAKIFSRGSVPGQTWFDNTSNPPFVVMRPRFAYAPITSWYDMARIVGHGTRVTEALRGGEVARAVDPDVKAGRHQVRSDRNAERVRRIAHRGLDFSRRTHIRLQIIVVESAYPRHLEGHLSQI